MEVVQEYLTNRFQKDVFIYEGKGIAVPVC